MNLIQKLGIGLFTISLITFLVSLSLSKFQLTEEVLKENIAENKIPALQAQAQGMLGKEYSSQFSFVADFKAALNNTNQALKDKYSITEAELAQLASLNQESYQLSTVDAVFPTGDEVNDFKNKALKDYSGWMEGREYASAEAIKNDLSGQVSNINNSIADNKGFASYEVKNLLFPITKDSSAGIIVQQSGFLFVLIFVVGVIGALMYILPKVETDGPPGIKNNHIFHSGINNRGLIGIIMGIFLISFYVFLYWYAEYITNWVILVDPVSKAISGNEASQWFLYGFLYTLCILVMGIRMMIKYRHSTYQIVRTASVMFFQTAFAFLIPEILVRLNQPYMDFKNIWPLDYDFFYGYQLDTFMSSGAIGTFMLVWGVALIIIGVPVFTFFYGKRWYCSWVCGCGGLAETLGDPYRQLSDKSLGAWKIERYLIHSVLVFAVMMTGLTLYTYFSGSSSVLGLSTYSVQKSYGFLIGAGFAGVVGTGFYPLMGNRVWCRFGCPLAAYLGLVQRFRSRFRITTNGGQCISCGNCSTYCEMGIDVRWYAQRGQNIVRSSCVGCGICSAVCPRGVLNLENGPTQGRINSNPILLGNDGVKVQA